MQENQVLEDFENLVDIESVEAETEEGMSGIETENTEDLENKLEALVFSYAEAISVKKLSTIVNVAQDDVKKALLSLKERYENSNSAIELVFINLSVQFVVKNDYSCYIDKLYGTDTKKGLSNAQLEVLSIIAYEQPATKRDIERIRGIKSGRIVEQLIDEELIKAVGKKDAPGMPTLYATAEKFLLKFGMKNLSELPKLSKNEDIKLFEE